ncbi:MAG: hypothetical protein R3B96_03785 [Pirellulaceae bacterium]
MSWITELGTIAVDVEVGFTGDLADFVIESGAGEWTVLEAMGGADFGQDVVVRIGADQFVGQGAEVELRLAQATVSLEFAVGFSGEFDPDQIFGHATRVHFEFLGRYSNRGRASIARDVIGVVP